MADLTSAPKHYTLLHNAVILARQLEAAGLPEGGWERYASEDGYDLIGFSWDYGAITADLAAEENWVQWHIGEVCQQGFSLGEPLPDALVAAIKATQA